MERRNAVDRVCHVLLQWLDRKRHLTRLEALPIRDKLRLMNLRPRFYKSPLTSEYRSGNQFYRIKAKHGRFVLIVGVKMR